MTDFVQKNMTNSIQTKMDDLISHMKYSFIYTIIISILCYMYYLYLNKSDNIFIFIAVCTGVAHPFCSEASRLEFLPPQKVLLCCLDLRVVHIKDCGASAPHERDHRVLQGFLHHFSRHRERLALEAEGLLAGSPQLKKTRVLTLTDQEKIGLTTCVFSPVFGL